MHAYVGGITAIYQDFATVLTAKLPLFIGVVIGLGFLLLLIAFRSLVVPLAAAVMNLLAAGASFGVLVGLPVRLGLGRPRPGRPPVLSRPGCRS
jgi:RND superfamily putative drug exporter